MAVRTHGQEEEKVTDVFGWRPSFLLLLIPSKDVLNPQRGPRTRISLLPPPPLGPRRGIELGDQVGINLASLSLPPGFVSKWFLSFFLSSFFPSCPPRLLFSPFLTLQGSGSLSCWRKGLCVYSAAGSSATLLFVQRLAKCCEMALLTRWWRIGYWRISEKLFVFHSEREKGSSSKTRWIGGNVEYLYVISVWERLHCCQVDSHWPSLNLTRS